MLYFLSQLTFVVLKYFDINLLSRFILKFLMLQPVPDTPPPLSIGCNPRHNENICSWFTLSSGTLYSSGTIQNPSLSTVRVSSIIITSFARSSSPFTIRFIKLQLITLICPTKKNNLNQNMMNTLIKNMWRWRWKLFLTQRHWFCLTNSDFIILLSLQPNVVDLWYFKLCILLYQIA